MPPAPLESGGNAAPLSDSGSAGMGGQIGTISLGMLIQYINQRTYSDLLNMAEILPRKGDLEKKIDIVQYAQRTRQLYVRLLALVKWAASASKVDKCCNITGFLEKQNSLIIDTADKLFHMTKENLVHARLPHFHIPAAVETLTTGSYNRLPLTVRQRILSTEPITQQERKQTLSKLEQIVHHRLVTTELPPQMRTSKMENGTVRFTVDFEFEVVLTLMSDAPGEVWRLLEVDIAVEDKETGEGKALVHPLQINYVHQLVQSRLQDSQNPLLELYTVLHSFCQSLQLEVLYAQTLKLVEERLDFHIRVEEYVQGKSLTLTYWRELTHRDPTVQLGYRLTVQVDPSHHARPLMLLHTPSLGTREAEIAERAIRSDKLSIERLLVHTIYLRTRSRLSELKQELDIKLVDGEKCQLSGSPAVLHVPVLQPCFRSDQLLVAVDTHTGVLLAHVPQYEAFPRITELQNSLNTDKQKLDELLSELRYWMMVRRTEKTLQHLEATAHERLPLMFPSTHPLHSLSKHKVFITFHRHPTYILIVEFRESSESVCEMEWRMFLLMVKEADIEVDPDDEAGQTSLPKSYLRAYRLVPLDPFVCLQGPTTKIDSLEPADASSGGKRKLQVMTPLKSADGPNKRVKSPAYFLRDVAQVVAMCDHIYPLAHVGYELQQMGVRTGGIQVEEGGVGVVLRLVDLPSTRDLPPDTVRILTTHLLSATIRTTVMLKFNSPLHYKNLTLEYMFSQCPLVSLSPREAGPRRLVLFTYDTPGPDSVSWTVQSIVSDWTAIARLYELVLAFAHVYNEPSSGTAAGGMPPFSSGGVGGAKGLGEMVKVRSFNYRSVTLSYGPGFDAYVTVRYSIEKKRFTLNFGMMGTGVWATNAHTLLGPQLEDMLNTEGSRGLVHLAVLLHNTYHPLLALSKLQPTLHPGATDKTSSQCRPHPIQIFGVVATSSTRVRIFYRSLYCLEVDFLPHGLVSVRDGVFSSFQMSRAIEDFAPIKGLKAFLSKFVDEGAISRRRSQSEDDNPPTPIPLEDSWPAPKSASPARHGPITPPVSSNPHTPSSPHPGGVAGGHAGFSASPATVAGGFSSPPSLPSMNPSPVALMSHPSPGYLGANSPSAGAHNVASPSFLPSHSPAAAASFVPGGTSNLPPVPRILPNRPFAAAIPTVLTHDAFHTLCSPPQVPEVRSTPGRCCVLEQFLGATSLCKAIHQYVRAADSSQASASQGGSSVPLKEPNCVQLKLETLTATFTLETTPLHRLVLRLQASLEFPDRWTPDELLALETLFATKVSCPPYKLQVVEAFYRLLCFPYKLLKDCVRLIHLELYPPGPQQSPLKWNFQWCFTVPALGKYLIPPGQMAVHTAKNKYLFYIHLTRAIPPGLMTEGAPEPLVLVLPLIHDINTNKTMVAKRMDLNMNDPGDRLIQALNDAMLRAPLAPLECSIYPYIREILYNFTQGIDTPGGPLPQQPQGQPPPQQQQQQQQQQPTQQQQGGPQGGGPTSNVGGMSPVMSSPHLSSPLMSSPHTPSSTNVSTTSTTASHYGAGPPGAGINMGHPQGMGSMSMAGMASMTHGAMGGTMIQGGPGGRTPMQGPPPQMQNMSPMQANMQGAPQGGFAGNMMGQYQR